MKTLHFPFVFLSDLLHGLDALVVCLKVWVLLDYHRLLLPHALFNLERVQLLLQLLILLIQVLNDGFVSALLLHIDLLLSGGGGSVHPGDLADGLGFKPRMLF